MFILGSTITDRVGTGSGSLCGLGAGAGAGSLCGLGAGAGAGAGALHPP